MSEQSSFGEHLVSDVSGWSRHGIAGFGPFRLDAANEQLWRGDTLIALKPKTFAVLRYFTDHPGRLITKHELLDRLWSDQHVGDAVLKTHVRDIRQALEDSVRAPRFIETAHRRGYRFICRVERQRVASATASQQAFTAAQAR
jgi:DNA-binding winged helix-turn-helix (wHTH) protein